MSNSSTNRIESVPTNIITGFLGVGKTTAILHLLKSKPKGEKWAILVNEFGEIGVDGSLLAGGSLIDEEVFIREVPGGCMCCAAGLPMQIALNQLLIQSKPDRLFIEPTGLGHPVEVIQVLSEQYYKSSLNLHNIITLVDARKLSNDEYVSNKTFRQQLEVADIIVANKCDLYSDKDKEVLRLFADENDFKYANIKLVKHGALDIDWLNSISTKANFLRTESTEETVSYQSSDLVEQEIPESGFFQAVNQGDGFKSEGWRVSPEIVFDNEKLVTWLHSIDVERMKAVIITNKGIYGFNLSDGLLTQIEIDECFESRIEIIYSGKRVFFEESLKSCMDNSC